MGEETGAALRGGADGAVPFGTDAGDPSIAAVDEHDRDEPAAPRARGTIVREVEFPSFADEASAPGEGGIERLLDVRLTLAVELGRRDMLVQEVLNLGKGSVLDLLKPSSEPVDVLVNGKLLARGEVVVIDESFGVRITALVDPVERVKRIG
jgi:flagellar motor switch protein FliN